MSITKVPLGAVAASALLVAATGAWAQQPAQQQQPQVQQQQPQHKQVQPQQQVQPQAQPRQQVAQQCLNDLHALNRQMEQDGYWLAGWGTRWGTPAQPTTGRAPARAPGATGAAPPATTPGVAQSPWGQQQFGLASPRYQIRVLHSATQVLAHRGDEQVCQQMLAQTRAVYEGYVAQLRQAGVEPGQVTTWRQDRIASAQPVQQLQIGGINVDNITGTEIRNGADQRLGTIDDVLVDPQTGQISYVIVNRGGFFGIGADDVPVPWAALRATPDLNLFVLNVSQQVFEQAPQMADAGWFQQPTLHQHERQRVDQFWQQHRG